MVNPVNDRCIEIRPRGKISTEGLDTHHLHDVGGAIAMKSAMRTSSLEAYKAVFEALRADLERVLDARSET
jgi:hypothetical protein